jgi:hypothetical protein
MSCLRRHKGGQEGTDLGVWCLFLVSITPRLFSLLNDSVPSFQEVSFASGPVWMETEILAHTGIQSPDLPVRNELQCNSLKQCSNLHALPVVILNLCVQEITIYRFLWFWQEIYTITQYSTNRFGPPNAVSLFPVMYKINSYVSFSWS